MEEVIDTLESLVKVATRDHKYFSSIDLRSLNTTAGSPTGGMQDSWLTTLNSAPASGNSTGFSRSMSLGNFQSATQELSPPAPVKISANLNEFLGTIEDEEDEEDIFF